METSPAKHPSLEPGRPSLEEQRPSRTKRKRKVRVRLLPIWLRIVLVFVLSILALSLGLMFGYGVIGDGNPFDVFKRDTWQHIIDIVTKAS